MARRLKLSPLRGEGSSSLDGLVIPVTRNRSVTVPEYVRWDHFYSWFGANWKQGQHVTLIGTTQSGKTTLARHILHFRQHVIVLATKQRDPSLYRPLMKAGFQVIRRVEDLSEAGPKVIFRPGLETPDKVGMDEQAAAFAALLTYVYNCGGYCLYADEIRYLTDNLGLKTEMETLWLQGSSLGVTVVVATQRPVSIPLLAFDQAKHLFLWRNSDRESVRRMSEFAGAGSETVAQTIPRLPPHECLYVDTREDRICRTKVIL